MYIACETDQEDTIHTFGEGSTQQEALDNLANEMHVITEFKEDGERFSIGVYRAVYQDQMDSDMLELAESEGWQWMLGNCEKQVEYIMVGEGHEIFTAEAANETF